MVSIQNNRFRELKREQKQIKKDQKLAIKAIEKATLEELKRIRDDKLLTSKMSPEEAKN